MKKILPALLCAFVMCGCSGKWKEERSRLLKDADEQVQAEVEKMVDEERTAKSSGLHWPIMENKLPLSTVFDEAEKDAEAAAQKKYPESVFEELRKSIENEYFLYKEGDEVTIKVNMKSGYEISGRISSIKRGRIRIGKDWINPNADLDEETRARFFQDECKQLQNKKYTLAKQKLVYEIEDFRKSEYHRILADKLKSSGYVPVSADPFGRGYYERENWTTERALLDEKLAALRVSVENEVRSRITEKVMKDGGFSFDNASKQWKPAK